MSVSESGPHSLKQLLFILFIVYLHFKGTDVLHVVDILIMVHKFVKRTIPFPANIFVERVIKC